MTATRVVNGKDFCAIVFIGGGSSWCWGSDPDVAALKAAKQAKSDWRPYFRFDNHHKFNVSVLDMKGRDGWYADETGIYDTKTNERIPVMEVKKVVA